MGETERARLSCLTFQWDVQNRNLKTGWLCDWVKKHSLMQRLFNTIWQRSRSIAPWAAAAYCSLLNTFRSREEEMSHQKRREDRCLSPSVGPTPFSYLSYKIKTVSLQSIITNGHLNKKKQQSSCFYPFKSLRFISLKLIKPNILLVIVFKVCLIFVKFFFKVHIRFCGHTQTWNKTSSITINH